MFEYGQNIQDRTQTQLHLLHSSIFVRSGSIFFTVSNSSSCISRGECSDSLAFRSSYWGTCFVGCTLCVNWTVYTCCDNNNLTCVWFVCLFVDVFGQVPTQHQSSFDSSSMRTSRSHQLFWWEPGISAFLWFPIVFFTVAATMILPPLVRGEAEGRQDLSWDRPGCSNRGWVSHQDLLGLWGRGRGGTQDHGWHRRQPILCKNNQFKYVYLYIFVQLDY